MQNLLDVVNADDNAPLKVLRLRIKDETGGAAPSSNMLQPLDGDDSFKPPPDDSQVGKGRETQGLCWRLPREMDKLLLQY